MKFIQSAGLLLGVFGVTLLPVGSFASSEYLKQSIKVSLVGYAESDYSLSTNNSGTVITEKQKLKKFKTTQKDIIQEIGVLTTNSFSSSAKMYVDGNQIVITDGDAEPYYTPESVASASRTDGAYADAYTIKTYPEKQKETISAKSRADLVILFQVGAMEIDLRGFSTESLKQTDDEGKSEFKLKDSENVKVVGAATDAGESYAVSGTVKSSYKEKSVE